MQIAVNFKFGADFNNDIHSLFFRSSFLLSDTSTVSSSSDGVQEYSRSSNLGRMSTAKRPPVESRDFAGGDVRYKSSSKRRKIEKDKKWEGANEFEAHARGDNSKVSSVRERLVNSSAFVYKLGQKGTKELPKDSREELRPLALLCSSTERRSSVDRSENRTRQHSEAPTLKGERKRDVANKKATSGRYRERSSSVDQNVHTSAVSREEVSTVQVGSPVKSRKNGVLQKQKSEDVCDSKRMGHYPREEPSKKGKTSFRIPKLSRRTSTDSSSSTGSKESVRTRAFSVDLSQESSDERTHNVKEKTLSSLTVKKRDRLYNANVKRRRIYPKSSESDDDASRGSVLALFQSKPKVQSRSKTDVGCGRRSPGFPKGRSSSSKDSINSSQHSPSRSLCVSPVSSGPSSPTVQPSASPLPLQGTSITKTSPSALVICSSPESAPPSPDLPTSDCPVTAMQSSSPYKSTPLSTIDTAASKSYTAVPSPSRPKIVTPVVLSAGQTVPKAPEDDPVSNNPPESPFSPSSVIPLRENDNCSQFVVELKMESQLTDDSSDKVCKSPAPNELEVVKNKENKTDKVICIDTSNLTDGGDKQAESSHDEDEEQGCHHKNMDGKQCKRIVLEGKRVCDIHHKVVM